MCSQALGLADRTKILDSSMITPDGAVVSGKEGHYARLNNNEAWCIPQLRIDEDIFREGIHLDINLGQMKMITAIAVQGLDQYSPGRKIRLTYDLGGGIFLDRSPDVNIPLFCFYFIFVELLVGILFRKVYLARFYYSIVRHSLVEHLLYKIFIVISR